MREAVREMTFEEEYEDLKKRAMEVFATEDLSSEPITESCLLRQALRCIDKLLRSQPQADKWIPVEESLPEEHGGIYAELIRRGFKGCPYEKSSDVVEVTLKSKDGKIRTTKSMTYDGKWDVEWESKEVGYNKIKKVRTDETVIAWIPQRRPYKKEGAENG